MKTPLVLLALIITVFISNAAAPMQKAVRARVSGELPSLEKLYRHLHANPEISFQEKETAKVLAAELRRAGFEVSTGIGGHGVVGVLKNGAGPTVLVIAGGLAQLYVIIIGGQAYPLELFPGLEERSGFFDGVINSYSPSLPEMALGVGGMALAAVIGVPDPIRTESIKAYIVPREGVTETPELIRAIQDHVKTRLAAHEYPREVEFVDALPMTATGKIIRRELRARNRGYTSERSY